ncbi:MAG: peptidoglycan DD-metalloendopeptidase family protein [Desulfatiglandales bacterium]
MRGFHIILLAEGKQVIKYMSLSRRLSLLLFILALGAIITCSIFARDYLKMRKKMEKAQLQTELVKIEEKSQQAEQLFSLAMKLQELRENISRLSEVEEIALAMMKGKRISSGHEAMDGIGGSDSRPLDMELLLMANKDELIKRINASLTEIEEKVARLEDAKKEFKKYLESQSIKLASIPSIWPVSGVISSPYGYRSSPFQERGEFHRGVDIRAPYGSPVKASADGVIREIGYQAAYGRYVELDHKNGFSTKYAHLSKVLVKEGMSVKKGQIIGLVGTTGNSTGPHLHYEVTFKGAPVNPNPYLAGSISLLLKGK